MEDYQNTIEELIKRAKNGEEMFWKSPHFNSALNLMARGADPVPIIENICEVLEKVQSEYSKLLETHGPCKE